jgi:hypothetical protein
MTKKNGGPAFPFQHGPFGGGESEYNDGMLLRDWFAGQALVGLITAWRVHHSGQGDEGVTSEPLVRGAYAIADAMIAEREK